MLGGMDVGAWLETLGLGRYARVFAENDIDFALLAQLTDAELKELGIGSLGHRKRILAAAAETASPSPAARPLAPTLSNERRQVTILFADLSGFTELSQSLDPEELHELVGRYTADADRVVLEYGGTVDKHIGDAVMALFGAPRAHDDDPLRAARAALDIHEAVRRLGAGLGRELKAHVGIASGEVVAGAVGRADLQDYTVLGESVNLAARLVSAAAPGETMISEAVHRALGGHVVSEAIGELRFKGIEAPVRVWRLRALGADGPSAIRSPFIGRDAELEQFKGILSVCLGRRCGQVVYVRGEAGIGKTRLVDEMRRIAKERGFTDHRALVLDFGVGKGQDPIRTIVRSLLGLPSGADTEERQSAADRVAAEGSIGAERLAFLYDLLDLPQRGEQRAIYDAMDNTARNRGKGALVAGLVETACSCAPTMIVVEDLHWADPLTLRHIAAIAAAIADGPGLLLATSRIEGDRLDAAWRASCRTTPFATIDLGPLRHEEAIDLARSFTEATQHLALACVERAGGNPLFLEQLLRNAEEGREDSVPASIQSLVLARMDRLPPADRLAFQAAAVVGQRFDLEVLRHLVALPDYVCDVLIAHALVIPEGDGFLFGHALIREGAYSSLLKARRRELHRAAADWFAPKDPVLRARHLDLAEDKGAPAAYLEAATAQRAAYHVDTALRLAERGLEIVDEPTERHALACLKGVMQRDLGDIALSIATFREAVVGAPDAVGLCRAQLGLAEGLRVSEGLAEALDLLDRAEEVAKPHRLQAELARLHHLRGNIFFPLGKIDECRAEHEKGLAYARQLASPEAEARALGGLADAAYAQGRMRTAFGHFSRCVSLSREHGFGRIEVANRSMVGFSRLYLNEGREAREDGAAAALAAAIVGQPRAEMLGETMGVFACYELGDYDAMSARLERESQLIRQLGALRFEAQNLEMRARLALDAGRREEALSAARQALGICREAGMQFCGPKVIGVLTRAVGDRAERLRLVAEGENLLGRGAVGHNHLWFHRDAIEGMLEAGETAAALRHAMALDDYTRAEPLPWADLFIARARALAALAEGRREEAIRRELVRISGIMRETGLRAFLPRVEAALAAGFSGPPAR